MSSAGKRRARHPVSAVIACCALLAFPAASTAAEIPGAEESFPAVVPDDSPPALRAPAKELPAPKRWKLPEDFPQTSGTGRYKAGAYLWSDFIYDDHGARGLTPKQYPGSLAPPDGTYAYPEGSAHGNGADIFRAGIGHKGNATIWRVDWNTLADPAVPIAMFALDTDSDPGTGTSDWPGGAGLSSPGNEAFLALSASGAWLFDESGVTRVAEKGKSYSVDTDSGSFVAEIAARDLGYRGKAGQDLKDEQWIVRLASGLAGDDGRSFAEAEGKSQPGQPNAYNLAFRGVADERPRGNFWMEDAQAEALAGGENPFAQQVDWQRITEQRSSPEPRPTGYSNRWYVSSIKPGTGVKTDEAYTGDGRPNFFGRVQPYAVWVPESYDPKQRNDLVWLLHSLSVNHNQYGAINSNYLERACERGGRICATTLGRGPDGWFMDEAELDFWEVWADIARNYHLDHRTASLTGYSMGGFGTYRLGLTHPGAFARAHALAGPPQIGIGLGSDLTLGAGSGRAAQSPTGPLAANGRWIVWYVAHGALDELVPLTGVLDQVGRLDAAGLRYTFDLYPAEDHLLYAAQDGFERAAQQLDDRRRVPYRPESLEYSWYPGLRDDDLGIGPRGAYWLDGMIGYAGADDRIAHASGRSYAFPNRQPTTTWQSTYPLTGDGAGGPQQSGLEAVLGSTGEGLGAPADLLADLAADLLNSGSPAVGLRTQQGWRADGSAPKPAGCPAAVVELADVRKAIVNAWYSGLSDSERYMVLVKTNRPVTLGLSRTGAGEPVKVNFAQVGETVAGSPTTVKLPAGIRAVTVGAGIERCWRDLVAANAPAQSKLAKRIRR